MRNCRLALFALAAMAAASCAPKTHIDCTIDGAAGAEVVVKQLNLNVYDVIDTLKADASGKVSCDVAVAEGQPEFIDIFCNGRKVACLLLESGERVSVKADTLGSWTVEGSEGSSKLAEVDRQFEDFKYRMAAIIMGIDNARTDEEAQALQVELNKEYVAQYRRNVEYILRNPGSMTCIPVLYQKVNDRSPMFPQLTDAIHFRAVCDSLKTRYPESRYVKALEQETSRREQVLGMDVKLRSAKEIGFPDVALPDVNGAKVALSSVDAKVVLLHFWTSVEPDHKMFNISTLKPLYEKWHDRGLEIYSVCIDPDKAQWATTVRLQELPWINVNDGLGTASPVLAYYNVAALPSMIIISDGVMTGGVTPDNLGAMIEKAF